MISPYLLTQIAAQETTLSNNNIPRTLFYLTLHSSSWNPCLIPLGRINTWDLQKCHISLLSRSLSKLQQMQASGLARYPFQIITL